MDAVRDDSSKGHHTTCIQSRRRQEEDTYKSWKNCSAWWGNSSPTTGRRDTKNEMTRLKVKSVMLRSLAELVPALVLARPSMAAWLVFVWKLVAEVRLAKLLLALPPLARPFLKEPAGPVNGGAMDDDMLPNPTLPKLGALRCLLRSRSRCALRCC